MDASVVVKWFHEEEHTMEALMLREAHDDDLCELIAPAILPYGVSNALMKPPNLFSMEDILNAVQAIYLRLPALKAPYLEDVGKTVKKAFQLRITVYDAAYIVLAEDEGSTLITGDKELYTRVHDEKLVLFLGSGRFKELIQELRHAEDPASVQ